MSKPLVSVIMSVCNTPEKYLREAIESILKQRYEKLEFIIIDDGSEAWCKEVLYSYTDARIRLYHNETNIGLTPSLNRALDYAEGDYIARMDADDISLPDRLGEQLNYLKNHRDVDVLACVACLWENGEKAGGKRSCRGYAGIYRQFEQERMRVRLSLANIEFVHPTVMFRRSFLEQQHLRYDEVYKKAQDYNMWVRCIECGKLDVLQKPLFISRLHQERIGSNNVDEQQKYADDTKRMCLKRLLPDFTDRQAELYVHFRDVELYGSVEENMGLLDELLRANERLGIYDEKLYRQELLFWWFRKALNPVNKPYTKVLLWQICFEKSGWKIFCPQLCRYMADYADKYKKRQHYDRRLHA